MQVVRALLRQAIAQPGQLFYGKYVIFLLICCGLRRSNNLMVMGQSHSNTFPAV
ncbi:hypothetical protein D3C80_1930270 [compost metagenome]